MEQAIKLAAFLGVLSVTMVGIMSIVFLPVLHRYFIEKTKLVIAETELAEAETRVAEHVLLHDQFDDEDEEKYA